ncbi:MAG: YceI family protein [Ignavibacteria bacterium]|nr:YceI family protein [Ignavibacteria bacterium]
MKNSNKNIILLSVFVILLAIFSLNCGKSEKEVKISNTQDKVAEIKEGNKIYKLDVKESEIQWIGKKVTGQHNGLIKFKDGQLALDNGKISAGNFTVDMNSISCSDLTDANLNAKLVGHLKSEDFFLVQKFPESKFEIINLSEIKESNEKGFNYNVTGKMTIKDSTKTITFPAKIKLEENLIIAEADFEIDRTEFGIKYGSGKFFEGLGDKMIRDNFNLIIKIVAKP